MAKHNQNQEKQNITPRNKKKPKCHDPTLCHYSPPWGVHFFCFFVSPKEEYSYSEGYVCFEYCICWQVWGCCNYVGVI